MCGVVVGHTARLDGTVLSDVSMTEAHDRSQYQVLQVSITFRKLANFNCFYFLLSVVENFNCCSAVYEIWLSNFFGGK